MAFPVYCILSLLASAGIARAHGYVYTWTINGEAKRGATPGGGSNGGAGRPSDDPDWGPAPRDTPAVACGSLDQGSGLETWTLDAGSQVVAAWTGPSNGNSVWPPAHHGPLMAYMAKCPGTTCDGVDAAPLKWFKIGQSSWDGQQWPTKKITADEPWTFTVPSDIAPGPYLVRHEIVAMHFTWETKGFEVYPYCFQANVASSGTAEPTDTTSFPAAYSPKEYPSYQTSVREDGTQGWNGENFDNYVPPGPPVYIGGGGSGDFSAGAGNSTNGSSKTAMSVTNPSPSGSIGNGASELSPSSETSSSDDNSGDSGSSDSSGASANGNSSNEEEDPMSTASAGSSTKASSETDQGEDISSSRTRGRWRSHTKSRTSSAQQAEETGAKHEAEGEGGGHTGGDDEETGAGDAESGDGDEEYDEDE